MRAALALVVTTTLTTAALAHDDAKWIQDRALRNTAGEWCCGAHDCTPYQNFTRTPTSIVLPGGEVIPLSEAMPMSPDGRVWVCRRPGGSRRCVFWTPPPGS